MNISEQYYENCKKKSEFKDIKNERFDKWRARIEWYKVVVPNINQTAVEKHNFPNNLSTIKKDEKIWQGSVQK